MVVVGLVVVVLLLTLGCVALMASTPSTTTTTNPTATPAATTPPQATATPTAAPTAQPTAAPTAAPSITPLSASDLAALETMLQGDGYTIIDHFVQNGTTADGYPMYSGLMLKDNVVYGVVVMQADSAAHAQTLLGTAVTSVEGMGYSGAYTDATHWSGSMISPNTGNPEGASVLVSGNNVIATFAEGAE